MADIPLYPTAENVDTFRDIADVQKQILDLLMAQKKEYEHIGRINLDVEKRVVQRRQNERRMMDEIQGKFIEYEAAQVQLVAARGDKELKTAKQLIESIKAEISDTQKMISMSREANEIEIGMAKRRYDDEHKYFTFASAQAKKMFGIKVDELDLTKDMGEELIKIGARTEMTAYFWGGILMMLKGAYDLFVKFDKAAWEFRKAMGLTRNESGVIRKDAEKIAIDYMDIGVTVDSVYKSYKAIGTAVGGIHNVSASMVKDVAVMAAQLGISEETSAAFMRNLAEISKSSMESQTNMMYMAQSLSSAAGVNLGQVMGDVATKSSKTLTMMSRMPTTALKSAIELRRMGTSLDQAAASSRHILDFTENVNEEMEASVLLGRSINLQRARELAYRRDLEGSTKEILRITKSVNFENLDVFQQEAFAKATGKSVDELLKMLQADRQIEKVRRAGTPEQLKMLHQYEAMRKENEAIAKARAKDVGVMLQQQANQERLTAITNKWKKLLADAQSFLLPVVDKMLELVVPAMDVAMAIAKWSFVLGAPLAALGTMGKMMQTMGLEMAVFFDKSAKVSSFFLKFGSIGEKLMGPWARVSALFGGVLGKLGFFGKFLGFFGKLLGPIGWVITAFQAIGGFIKGWNSTTGSWVQKLGGGLMGALRGIIPGFDYILKAIKWIWGWSVKIVAFSFKWLTPLGLIIQGFKFLKKMFPETFAALGNLFGKIWGVYKKILGVEWQIVKMIFGQWWAGVKMIWSGIKMVWNAFAEPIAAIWGMIKSFFGLIGAYWRAYVSGPIEKFFGMFSGGLDHMLASLVSGFTSIASDMWHALTDPFREAWNWVKGLWGGNSPSEVGLSILRGLMSIGPMVFDALTAPFRRGMAWIMDKIPGMGKMAEKLKGGISGAVEKKATAAYIPAVTVTPEGTKIETSKAKAAGAKKEEEKAEEPMSEATGQKIVSLLEKILAKDNNISMDGQLLSTHLARQTEFRGGYGVNKVA